MNDCVCRSVMHRPAAPLESRAIAKAPEGEGCPRCGGYVYMAEQMLAKGRVSMIVNLVYEEQRKKKTFLSRCVCVVYRILHDRYGILGIP